MLESSEELSGARIRELIMNAAADDATDFGGAESREERHDERLIAQFEAVLSCRGAFQTVKVRDISDTGARIGDAYGLFQGDPIRLRLPNGNKLIGRVVWSLGSNCGIEFVDTN